MKTYFNIDTVLQCSAHGLTADLCFISRLIVYSAFQWFRVLASHMGTHRIEFESVLRTGRDLAGVTIEKQKR